MSGRYLVAAGAVVVALVVGAVTPALAAGKNTAPPCAQVRPRGASHVPSCTTAQPPTSTTTVPATTTEPTIVPTTSATTTVTPETTTSTTTTVPLTTTEPTSTSTAPPTTEPSTEPTSTTVVPTTTTTAAGPGTAYFGHVSTTVPGGGGPVLTFTYQLFCDPGDTITGVSSVGFINLVSHNLTKDTSNPAHGTFVVTAMPVVQPTPATFSYRCTDDALPLSSSRRITMTTSWR